MKKQFILFILMIVIGCTMNQKQNPDQMKTHPPKLPVPIAETAFANSAIVDNRVRQYIYPRRILWQSPNTRQSKVEGVENLIGLRTQQVTLEEPACCKLTHHGAAPGILLDFGKELHGGIQIMVGRMESPQPVRFRVRFGESASEAMSGLGGVKNATNDHAVRDQELLVPWLGTAEIGNSGFRFVRLDLLDQNRTIPVVGVRAIFLYRDLDYLGSFQCNDSLLNQIWLTGAYTVHLCMQDFLWDGIKRDRLVWIGDMHPETMTILTVFGKHEIVPASLDLIKTATPLPNWMNGISSYSAWWLILQHDWYLYGGDKSYLEQQKAYVVGLLTQFLQYIGPDQREKLPEGRFLDWPTQANPQAVHAGLHAMLILTLKSGVRLCEILEQPTLGDECLAAIDRLKTYRPEPAKSKQAAALMVLADLINAKEMNQRVMAVDGARRLSTFYGYYVLQARALAEDYQGCLDAIRTYWGGMLAMGATTFWEDFDLDWIPNAARIDELVPPGKKDIHGDYGNYCYLGFRHSLCHGWASGPTAWLSEHVLGIKPVEPGFRVVRIEPHLGDLTWAEGTFPTPHGVIKVRHVKQADGTIRSTFDLPDGVVSQ